MASETVEIPDDLLNALEARAVVLNLNLNEIVLEILVREFGTRTPTA